MSTVIALIAVIPETVVAVREVRTMRVGPGKYMPSTIMSVAANGRGKDIALPFLLMEMDTQEERTAARADVLKQINALFDNYEATYGGKDKAVGQPDPGGQPGQQTGEAVRPGVAGADEQTPAGAPAGPGSSGAGPGGEGAN